MSRCLAGLLCAAALAARAEVLEFDFSRAATNRLPAGWQPALTGGGPPPRWEMRWLDAPTALAPFSPDAPATSSRAALGQVTADRTDERFPLLVYEPQEFGDFSLRVWLRPEAGVSERMAGIAFRYQNPSNYYVARVSALGTNLRFYKIVDGQRSPPVGPSLPVASGQWHELQLEARGNKIRLRVNDVEVPELSDTTFTRGRIALWTKSDSESWFAGLKVDFTPLVRPAESALRDAMDRFPRLLGASIVGRRTPETPWEVLAASDPAEMGRAASATELDVITREGPALARAKEHVTAFYPLRDRNGEVSGALRLKMTTFRGQTDANILSRGMPALALVQERLARAQSLTE
ncbi:MAG: family 16 glycoside hydrolase [Limisphaerales bacterium]